MTEQELVKGLAYLGTVYGKEYTSAECGIYYDFLKEYKYDIFIQAVKNIVRQSKFIPKVSDLVEECEKCNENVTFDILEFMSKQNYFKSPTEYDKAMKWLQTGVIPSWFKKDMEEYYKMMHQEKLGATERIMIGG